MVARRWLALVGCTLLLAVASSVRAAPLPPNLVVNRDERQCAEIFAGDECMDCFPPEGWEVVGYAHEQACPAGYIFVQDLETTCRGFKNEFCCSEGHSGAHGECEDLVINHRADECALVDEIEGCALPGGWEQRPGDLAPYEWYCPSGYNWVESPGCQGGGARPETARILTGAAVALVLGLGMIVLWSAARSKYGVNQGPPQ
jgi:hypothetical protein